MGNIGEIFMENTIVELFCEVGSDRGSDLKIYSGYAEEVGRGLRFWRGGRHVDMRSRV